MKPDGVRRAGPGWGAVAVLLGAAAWGSTGTAAHFAPPGATADSIGAARIAIGGAGLLIVALSTSASRRDAAGLLARRLSAEQADAEQARAQQANRHQGRRGGRTAARGGNWIAGWRAGSWRALLLLAAAAVAGYQVCFFTAVRETGVAIGTVVAIGSAPGWTGLLTLLTGGPRPGRRWVLATVAAVAGCVVLVTGGRASGVSPAGVTLALAAGLCYAVYAVVAARMITAGSAERAVMGLIFGGAAVLLAPVLAASDTGWLLTVRGLAVVGYLGVVTTVVAYLLYGRGLRTVPVPTATTLGLAEPAVAAVLGLLVLHERLSGPAIAGLVLVGLALASMAAAPAADHPEGIEQAGPPG
ncbi:MAG TPA: EamA family transporter [Streptosporangiaceae bacterium]